MKSVIRYRLVDGRVLLRLVEGDELAADAIVTEETYNDSIIGAYDAILEIVLSKDMVYEGIKLKEPKGESIDFRMGSVSSYSIVTESEFEFLGGKR